MKMKLPLEGGGTVQFDVGALQEIAGRAVPPEVLLEWPSVGGEPALSVRIEVTRGKPTCREVRITADPTGREVLDKDLRDVRLADLVPEAVAAASFEVEPGEAATTLRLDGPTEELEQRLRANRRRRRITPELLKDVADTYRTHFHEAPIEAIRNRFLVSRRTAETYVSRGTRGRLPATDHPREEGEVDQWPVSSALPPTAARLATGLDSAHPTARVARSGSAEGGTQRRGFTKPSTPRPLAASLIRNSAGRPSAHGGKHGEPRGSTCGRRRRQRRLLLPEPHRAHVRATSSSAGWTGRCCASGSPR